MVKLINKELAEIITAFLLGDFAIRERKNLTDSIYVAGEYCNKGIDMIRLAGTFKDRKLRRKFPQIFNNCNI